MPDFTVDIGGLDALGTNLDRTIENVDTATKKMEDVGPDSIGTDDLDGACADFRSDWKDGLDKIREAVDEVKGGLESAKKGYAELENQLKDSFSKMAKDVGGAGGSSGGTD